MVTLRQTAAFIERKLHINEKKVYLFLRTTAWFFGAFVLSCAAGLLAGYSIRQAGETIFLISGYTGAIVGLGAGVLKLMRE